MTDEQFEQAGYNVEAVREAVQTAVANGELAEVTGGSDGVVTGERECASPTL